MDITNENSQELLVNMQLMPYISKQHLEMYISHYYKEVYLKAYELMIYHVPSKKQRVKISFEPLNPPIVKKQPERPKKSRKRS